MSESNNGNTGTEDGRKRSDKDTAKARDVMRRDTPEGAPERGPKGASSDDRDKVYRPDENVDNQKSPEGQGHTGHNSSIRQTPLPGGQVKEKSSQKKNIDDKADDAESPRRDG